MNSNPVKNFIIIISCHLFFIYLFIHFFFEIFVFDGFIEPLQVSIGLLANLRWAGSLPSCGGEGRNRSTSFEWDQSSYYHQFLPYFAMRIQFLFRWFFYGTQRESASFFFLHWILRGGINSYSTCGPSVWEMIGGKPESVNIPFEWQIKFDDWFFFLSLEHWGSDFWGFSFSFWIVFSFCFIIVSLFLTHWINR